MRYQNLSLFRNHLKSSFPDHLSRFYLILSSDDYERRKGIEMIFPYLPEEEEKRIISGDFSLEEVLRDHSSSLFSSKLLALDFEIKKKDADLLLSFLSGFNGFLLLGSKTKQHIAPLYRLFEKEGIILDLLEEKKWEKEKRLKEAVWEKARQEKKTFSPDAIDLLFASLPSDLALLDAELEKLFTYTAQKKEIGKKDIENTLAASPSYTVWQVAEKIAWGEDWKESQLEEHLSPMFFMALRSELRKGLIIKELLLQGKGADEIGRHIPGIWPKALQKKMELAHALPLSYFQKGLLLLFEAELSSRNGCTNVELLLDLFARKLLHAASSSSQSPR